MDALTYYLKTAYTYIYLILQPILCNLAISLLQFKYHIISYHKQQNQTVLRDSILRLHIVGYSPKYIVKFENFYLKSTEFAVQICVPNYNEI